MALNGVLVFFAACLMGCAISAIDFTVNWVLGCRW